MTDPHHAQQHDLGEAVQLDNAETLAGPLGDDPLDSGWVPPDRPVAGRDPEEPESIADRIAGEEPDVADAAEEEADPRAGRLVAPDEGAHADVEAAEVASDVGIDGGAASAEEAAMHIEPER
jgi:hypothetical protein